MCENDVVLYYNLLVKIKSITYGFLVVQWNLEIKNMLGQGILSFIFYLEFKMYRIGMSIFSFIESCPLFGGYNVQA